MKRILGLIFVLSSFVMLTACGKKQAESEVSDAEIEALRAAYRSGASMESLLNKRIDGLYAKQKSEGKGVERLVPKADCIYDGDVTKLQACFDQAVTRLMALKPLENNVQKLNLATGVASKKGSFSYKVNATNILADGKPASIASVFQIGDAVPASFFGNLTGITASGPRFIFAALGTLLGATDGQSLAGGGVGAAFGYLDLTSLMVYYGAAGCAGGVVVSGGVPSADGVCGVIPVAAVPLIP